MDHIEKWIVDKAHTFPDGSPERRAIERVASAWREEGPTVVASWPPVHKAEPSAVTLPNRCKHCGQRIHRVAGGHGPVYVHSGTGAVAGSGAPRS